MIEVNPENATELARRVKAGELPGPAKSLAEAMARVMTQIGYVQKTGTVTIGQGYKYAGEAAFIAALRPELVAQQIVLCPVDMHPLVTEVFPGKHGPQNRIVLRVAFRLTHAPTGQTLDVVTCGEGIDSGDKATSKAMTGAMKYALRQAFLIETGNDPDDTPSREQERAAPSQRDLALEAVRAALDRKRLEQLYRDVQQDAKDGRLSAADAEEVFAAITHAAKKFPRPPEPKPQPAAGKGV